MTITLTPEELDEYQAKLGEWYNSRFTALVNALAIRFTPGDQNFMRDVVARHSEKHPKPKLLPSV